VVTAVPGGGRSPLEQVTWAPWGDLREPARSPVPPWPGSIPPPAPATVYPVALPAAVHDAAGRPVGITGRYAISAAPARIAVDDELPPGPGAVVGWAGPWPADERWWDPQTMRRRARLQVQTADGTGWLLALEDGRWCAEARYD
jgi:protein ImuB